MNERTPLAIADHLLAHDVPIVIIGGHCVNVHGFARATEDVDIVFRRSDEVQRRLAESLAAVNAYWIGAEIDPATGIEKIHPVTLSYVCANHLMMLGTDLGFLDLFDFVPAMPHASTEDLFATAIVRDGRPFASLEWIRRMKTASGRPIDQVDLENLPEVS